MAGATVGVVVLGRALVLTSSAAGAARGLGIMDNSSTTLPIRAVSTTPQASFRAMRISSSISSSSRGIQCSLSAAGFDTSTTGAAMVSNSAKLMRAAQVQRHLNPRPWDASRVAGGGLPVQAVYFAQWIEKVMKVLVRLLPGKAIVEKVEAEVDAATEMVEEGAKIVTDVADEVEKLANAAELEAEEVEKIAQKVEDATEKMKKAVDNVSDVLEGEKGASTLAETVDQLRNAAATKKAQE